MGILTGMSEHGQAGPPGRPPAPPAHARVREIVRKIQPHLTAIGTWARGLEPRFKRLGKRRLILLSALLAFLVVGGFGLAVFGARVQALRERHATGPSWAFPSLVFADGVPLTPGRPLPRGYLLKHLAAPEYQGV